jgi:hypothetical protein
LFLNAIPGALCALCVRLFLFYRELKRFRKLLAILEIESQLSSGTCELLAVRAMNC